MVHTTIIGKILIKYFVHVIDDGWVNILQKKNQIVLRFIFVMCIF